MEERLLNIKAKLKRKNIRVYYIVPDPGADYFFDTDSAIEDMQWMIAEIERLRLQVNDLSSPRDSGMGTRASKG